MCSFLANVSNYGAEGCISKKLENFDAVIATGRYLLQKRN